MEVQLASLSNIGGGLAPRLFEQGLRQVLDNINDESTDAKKARKVVLEFSIKPDQMRQITEIDVNLKTTLAPVCGKKALGYLSINDDGDPRLTTNDPKQAELAFGLAAKIAGDK